jgi:hypothetical protein
MMEEGDRLLARALATATLLGGLARAGLAMLGQGGAAAVPRLSAGRVPRRLGESGTVEQRPAPPAPREAVRPKRAAAGTASVVAQAPQTAVRALRLPPDAHGGLRPVPGAWPAPRPSPSGVAGTLVSAERLPDLGTPAPAAPVAWSWTVATSPPESRAAPTAPVASTVPQSTVRPAEPAPSMRSPPSAPGQAEPDEQGPLPFDNSQFAQWLDAHLDEAARRPPRGGTGFDPRLSPGWPGTLQGPWGWGG